MNAVGWILILLLILVIGFGIFSLVYYFVKIKPDQDKKNQGNTGLPPPPPPGPTGLSILTGNAPYSGVTNNTNGAVILLDPHGPVGPTGTTPTNVCSRYQWLYSGSTGTIIPIPGQTGNTGTGPTGGIAATVTGGTGGFLQANWQISNNFMRVVSSSALVGPQSGDLVVTDSVSSSWIFVPDTNNSNTGKWCLSNVTNKLLCLHYNTGPTGSTGPTGPNQQLTVQEFRLNNTTSSSDGGFIFNNLIPPLSTSSTPTTCNAG